MKDMETADYFMLMDEVKFLCFPPKKTFDDFFGLINEARNPGARD